MFVNNNGTDQPAQMRSLINAFVIHLLESIISNFATSTFYICSLGVWFETCFVRNPEDRFCGVGANRYEPFHLAYNYEALSRATNLFESIMSVR